MLPAAALDGQGDQREGESLKLSPPHLINEISFEGKFPPTVSPGAAQVTGGPVVQWDELRQPPQARTRKRPLLVSLTVAIPLLALLMILSACRAARLRERNGGAAPRRLSDSGESADGNQISFLEECLALEEELGVSNAEEPSSSSGRRSGRVAEQAPSPVRAAATAESAHGVQSPYGDGASSSPTIAGPSQTQPCEMPRGDQGLLEPGHGGWAHFDADSSQTSRADGSFGGKLPDLGPSAWLDAIPDISLEQEQQEQQMHEGLLSSGGGSGHHFAVSPSPVQTHDGRYASAWQGEHSSGRPLLRLPLLSRRRGGFPERERGGEAYPNAATLPASTGGGGFGGRLPALDPNAWLSGIFDITGAQGQQEWQEEPSSSGSGGRVSACGQAAFQVSPLPSHLPGEDHTREKEDANVRDRTYLQLPMVSRGEEGFPGRESGVGSHLGLHSLPTFLGGGGFGGGLPALDPNGWLEGIQDITGDHVRGEYWTQEGWPPSGSGSGDSRGGVAPTGALAPPHYSPGEAHANGGRGEPSSDHSFIRLLALSPREQGLLGHGHEHGGDAHPWPTSRAGGDVGGRLPALDPNAWLEGIFDINEDQGQEEQQSQGESSSAKSGSGESESGEGSTTLTASSPHSPDEEREHTSDDEDIKGHPFVRVPVIAEGVILRDFDVSTITATQRKYLPVVCILKQIRRLFLQPILHQREASELMTAIEHLVYSALANVKANALYPSSSLFLSSVGKYFLAFDCIVAARQVLGPHLRFEEWWNQFISAFNLNFPHYRERPVNKHSRHVTAFRKILVIRLLDVMEYYKGGRRPPLKTVVELKRLLLCSPYTHRRFLEGKWDPWRSDEEEALPRGHPRE